MSEQRTESDERLAPAKAKVFSRCKSPVAIRLTDRDVAVMEALWRHRCLSGDQLRRLVFECGRSMVRRRLRALYDHNLIDRVRVAAVPTRDIPPFLYTLSRQGAEMLPDLLLQFLPHAFDGDASYRICGLNGAGLRFVQHRFLVNEFHVSLMEAVRRLPYSVAWRHEEELAIPGRDGPRRSEVVVHPLLPKPTPFLPDGYFELKLPNGDSYAYFVEIDMATHAQRVWRERALLYSAYADRRAGLFRRRFGRENFRLAIATTPDYRQRSRRDNILNSIRRTIGPSDMFMAITFTDMNAQRMMSSVWRQADGSTRTHCLSENMQKVIVRDRSPTASPARSTPGTQRPGT